MLKQIRQLTAVQLCNVFGINEMIHTKDRKQKRRFVLMAVTCVALLVMVITYIVILSFGMAAIGMADIIPVYLYALTSLIIVWFSFMRASSIIFQMNTFELLSSLPVSKSAIVISRFLTMYSSNLAMSVLVMATGCVVYAVRVHPPVWFYCYSIVGTLFLPLFPMTVATAIGAAITAVSSRMKNKSLVSAALSILLVIGIIVANTILSGQTSGITEEMLKDLAPVLTAQIGAIYPPAIWFGDAVVYGDIGRLLLLLAISVLIFVLMIAVIQQHFLSICTTLHASVAKNNYTLQGLRTNSVVKALWKRELKRYFASSIYVTNTMIGYILMIAMSLALYFFGIETLETTIQIPGITEKILPIFLGAVAAIAPTTACSISMEGKQWWIAQTIPVKSKNIFDSKILVNLSLALPCYLIAVSIAWVSVRPSVMGSIWLAVMPAIYILFSSVVGIAINLAMPVMQWENETRVVKQSASTLITMLVALVSVLLPAGVLVAIQQIPVNAVMAATALALLIVTAILYGRNNKKTLIL